MIDYSWVPWFEELAAKIVEGGEDGLIEKATEIAWEKDGAEKTPALLKYQEEHGDKAIDPFSFLYFLAQKNTKNQYERVFGSVHKVFGIDRDFPSKRPFIPTPTPNTTVLFHNGQSFNPKLLWRLFRQAVPIDGEPVIQPDDFNAVLDLPNVGPSKLTQALFIANPSCFPPADREILAVLSKYEGVNDYRGYVAVMEAVRRRFPGCHPYEINTFIYTQASRHPLITMESSFFQVSTNVYDNKIDYWKWNDKWKEDRIWAFDQNNYVYTDDPEQERKYPLTDPERGDIILVRFDREGRAIGVVEDNDYNPEGWNEDGAIHVYWINKTAAEIEGGLPDIRFSRVEEATQTVFRNTDAYASSFDLIDRWIPAYAEPSLFDSIDRGTREGDGEATPVSETSTKKPDTSLPRNTILFGPPGTGKTWEAVSWAVAIVDGEEPEELVRVEDREAVKKRYAELRGEGRAELVTFHQSYAYEDFIEGIGPVLGEGDLRYELRNGIFKRISSRANKHPGERFVLVIDEINRGNIARIFGELITLIEPSKRAGREDEAVVTLPYSEESFSVPGNLYLVGTMNTADRGIALLDTALRRRFDFVERMPDVQLVEEDIEGVDGRAMLRAINERITVYLDREHQIGHTYLIGVKTIVPLAEAFQRRILPLLQEYFYDDWAKIRSVLNENPFIHERELKTPIPNDGPERTVFEVLPQDDDGWRQAESYRRIYTGEPAEDQD